MAEPVYTLKSAQSRRKDALCGRVDAMLDAVHMPEQLDFDAAQRLHQDLDTLIQECEEQDVGAVYHAKLPALKKLKLRVKERMTRLERPRTAAQGTQQMAASL